MLARRGETDEPQFETLDVQYTAMLARPLEEARRIAGFVGGDRGYSTPLSRTGTSPTGTAVAVTVCSG